MAKMPRQKPGKSYQDVGTPKWLLRLVEKTWGKITYDPAASEANHGHPWFGSPSFDITYDPAASEVNHACHNYDQGPMIDRDGLKQSWMERSSVQVEPDEDGNHMFGAGVVWVNPPYSDIAPWTHKTYLSSCAGCLVVMLVPASVGSNWWRQHVDGKAAVYFLSPRLSFIGHTTPYPKDCALLVYGAESPRYRCVRVTEDSVSWEQEEHGTYN